MCVQSAKVTANAKMTIMMICAAKLTFKLLEMSFSSFVKYILFSYAFSSSSSIGERSEAACVLSKL